MSARDFETTSYETRTQWPGENSLDAVKWPTTSRKLPAVPPASSLNNFQRCGAGAHPRQSCSAKDATCNRSGHFNSQCLSNTVATISATPHIQQPDTSTQ